MRQTVVGTRDRPALSQDGRWLASRHDGCIRIYNAATGALHVRHEPWLGADPSSLCTALAWSADLSLVFSSFNAANAAVETEDWVDMSFF